MKIRRRCECGCENITNYGKKYVHGHHRRGTGKTKISRRCKCGCGKITKPGNKYVNGHYWQDKYHTEESKLKQSISQIKCNSNDQYCDIWRDKEYKKDLRKDYCENINCRGDYKRLNNHHIDLNKKNCCPSNIMTLCNSCHILLHRNLEDGKKIAVNPKDFLIINRSDHISYINKRTRKKITIIRVINNVKRITNP